MANPNSSCGTSISGSARKVLLNQPSPTQNLLCRILPGRPSPTPPEGHQLPQARRRRRQPPARPLRHPYPSADQRRQRPLPQPLLALPPRVAPGLSARSPSNTTSAATKPIASSKSIPPAASRWRSSKKKPPRSTATTRRNSAKMSPTAAKSSGRANEQGKKPDNERPLGRSLDRRR